MIFGMWVGVRWRKVKVDFGLPGMCDWNCNGVFVKILNVEELKSGWTDRHVLWYTGRLDQVVHT